MFHAGSRAAFPRSLLHALAFSPFPAGMQAKVPAQARQRLPAGPALLPVRHAGNSSAPHPANRAAFRASKEFDRHIIPGLLDGEADAQPRFVFIPVLADESAYAQIPGPHIVVHIIFLNVHLAVQQGKRHLPLKAQASEKRCKMRKSSWLLSSRRECWFK